MIRTLPFMIGGIAFLLAACSPSSTGGEAPPEVEPDQVACPLQPMEPIDIEVIAAAYEANEAAAQKTYGGQCILVSGTVDEVTLDLSDEPVIRLAGKDFDQPRVRLLDAAQDQAAELAKGDKTLFLCNDVSEVLGTPVIDGCYVVFPKAQPTP